MDNVNGVLTIQCAKKSILFTKWLFDKTLLK